MLYNILILFITVLISGIECKIHSFPIEYIGKSLNLEEFQKLDICFSRICLRDSKRFIAHASYRNDSDPCVDFEQFACGHFLEYRPSNDRYYTTGFENDLQAQYEHYMKLMLKQKMKEDEPKIFKLVKNYYQKCVNSTYVRTEGKAEFKSLLYEFGKFPIFEDWNWKPSDFNVTNALIMGRELLNINVDIDHPSLVVMNINYPVVEAESISNVLNVDFDLSKELISEMYSNYLEFKHSITCSTGFYGDPNCTWREDLFTTVRDLDSYLNITSGLDWLEVIKSRTKNNDLNLDTTVRFEFHHNNVFDIFDLKNRRKLANFFTIDFLTPKLKYFSVYQKPQDKKRSKNRYETCIENIISFVNFPLEIMFQLKYGKTTTSTALEDFLMKYKLIEGSQDVFQVGFPVELTTNEFLDKVYANLNVTGDEGYYKLAYEMEKYSDSIYQQGYNSSFMENLSENARKIFKYCGANDVVINYDPRPCNLGYYSSLFKIRDTLYPLFHPDRPYFVNLAYITDIIGGLRIDLQNHYSKYVEQFGVEQNIPGFLMTNQQMLEIIKYQSKCHKYQNGNYGSFISLPSASVFNC